MTVSLAKLTTPQVAARLLSAMDGDNSHHNFDSGLGFRIQQNHLLTAVRRHLEDHEWSIKFSVWPCPAAMGMF